MTTENLTPNPDTAPEWGIVELMGHVQMAGRVSEETRFGATMGRIDVPQGDDFVTRYFGGAAVYRITMCDEATARIVAERGYIPTRPLALSAPMEDDERDDYDRDPFAEDESWERDREIASSEMTPERQADMDISSGEGWAAP